MRCSASNNEVANTSAQNGHRWGGFTELPQPKPVDHVRFDDLPKVSGNLLQSRDPFLSSSQRQNLGSVLARPSQKGIASLRSEAASLSPDAISAPRRSGFHVSTSA